MPVIVRPETITTRHLAAELAVTQERITDIARRLGVGTLPSRGRPRYRFTVEEADQIRTQVRRAVCR